MYSTDTCAPASPGSRPRWARTVSKKLTLALESADQDSADEDYAWPNAETPTNKPSTVSRKRVYKRSKTDATFAARTVTGDQLRALFPLQLGEAADKVGVRLNINIYHHTLCPMQQHSNVLAFKSSQVGRTLFKKICRRHGISNWPQNNLRNGKGKAGAVADVKLTKFDRNLYKAAMRGPSIAQPCHQFHESSTGGLTGVLCMSLSTPHSAWMC